MDSRRMSGTAGTAGTTGTAVSAGTGSANASISTSSGRSLSTGSNATATAATSATSTAAAAAAASATAGASSTAATRSQPSSTSAAAAATPKENRQPAGSQPRHRVIAANKHAVLLGAGGMPSSGSGSGGGPAAPGNRRPVTAHQQSHQQQQQQQQQQQGQHTQGSPKLHLQRPVARASSQPTLGAPPSSANAPRRPLQDNPNSINALSGGARPSSTRDPSLLTSSPIITKPIPTHQQQQQQLPVSQHPAHPQRSPLSTGFATLPRGGASPANSFNSNANGLKRSILRHRASLSSIPGEFAVGSFNDNGSHVSRDSVRSSRPPNPATTFSNMSKLMEIEIETLGKPLIDGYRVFIRKDDAMDMDGRPLQLLLFNNMLICGPWTEKTATQPQDPRQVYASQMTCSFDKQIALDKVGEQGALHLVSGQTSIGILFAHELERDGWVNTVFTTLDAHRATMIRYARRIQLQAQRTGGSNAGAAMSSPGVSPALAAMGLPSPLLLPQAERQQLAAAWVSAIEGTSYDSAHAGQEFAFGAGMRTRTPSVSTANSAGSAYAEKWIPDQEAVICMICRITKFNLFVRKHHCRTCGRVICHKCSVFRQSHKDASKVRVCTDCDCSTLYPTDDGPPYYFYDNESMYST
ncbi:hypothetical protein BC831DRAFT_416611 [Entophlyctis helioformis]|nr:hypothetical protein BC831DRAFT_416611 [Entophlyctis helioformis]